MSRSPSARWRRCRSKAARPTSCGAATCSSSSPTSTARTGSSIACCDRAGARSSTRCSRPTGSSRARPIACGGTMTWSWRAPITATMEAAMEAAGFRIDELVVIGSDWGEHAQETSGKPGRLLLHAARLLRDPERYVSQFGRDCVRDPPGRLLLARLRDDRQARAPRLRADAHLDRAEDPHGVDASGRNHLGASPDRATGAAGRKASLRAAPAAYESAARKSRRSVASSSGFSSATWWPQSIAAPRTSVAQPRQISAMSVP